MLPDSVRQPYIEFEHQLQHLQTLVTLANPDFREIQACFLEVQQAFQMHIAQPNWANLSEIDASRLSAVHTEIYKQLRLLATDVMFLQAARQPLTRQQRQAQMRDRLILVQRYCQAILATASPDPGGEDAQPMV
jgi:hypothetical protein